MATFFISDLHLGHQNMAVKRGFKDPYEMYCVIAENWNKVVSKRDKVYILGDVAMETHKFYFLLDTLNGIKEVILGNHDEPNHVKELLKYAKVSGLQSYKQKGYEKVFLSHSPIHPSELEYRAKYNIHGHVHENTLPDKRYINVSCEAVDYTPQLFNNLIKKQSS